MSSPGSEGAENRWLAEAAGRSASYDRRWEELAAEGRSVHGEADLVQSLGPASVLDAGCGTGRVAAELHRRGIFTVGVDIDESMLAKAREKAPGAAWVHHDLLTVDLLADDLLADDLLADDLLPPGQGRGFDVVVAAGNVMIFLTPGTEAAVVANLARHLAPGGALVAGFSLEPGRLDLAAYDAMAAAAGLVPGDRWSTWERGEFRGGDYAVSLHRRRP